MNWFSIFASCWNCCIWMIWTGCSPPRSLCAVSMTWRYSLTKEALLLVQPSSLNRVWAIFSMRACSLRSLWRVSSENSSTWGSICFWMDCFTWGFTWRVRWTETMGRLIPIFSATSCWVSFPSRRSVCSCEPLFFMYSQIAQGFTIVNIFINKLTVC